MIPPPPLFFGKEGEGLTDTVWNGKKSDKGKSLGVRGRGSTKKLGSFTEEEEDALGWGGTLRCDSTG